MRFQVIGSCPCIRTEEERRAIDKKAADAAFKRCKKERIDSFMTAQGFKKYKTNAYVRKNEIDLLEYVDFQKEQYGSKTFTVNLAVMPLYVPREYIVFGFSRRLGELICRRDIWWDFADGSACAASMENVKNALERFALPWFQRRTSERYIRLLLLWKKRTSRLSVYDEEWLAALNSRCDRDAAIRENMEKLGLLDLLI